MTTSDGALDTVRSFFSAKERHDLESVAGLLADEVVYRFPLPASGGQEYWFVYDGKEAALRNCGQVGSVRRCVGSIPAFLRISHTVGAAI